MTTIVNRVMAVAGILLSNVAIAVAGQDAQGPFVSANSLPPAEQIPAAPLLIAAYVFVWLALMGYLWSIWSRLGRVERDIESLKQQRARKTT
jgi:CcmD family protein